MVAAIPPGSSQSTLQPFAPQGANLGDHRVTNISSGVGEIVRKAKYEVSRVLHHWNEMGEKEKFYYKAAALCTIIALLIILFLTNLFGIAVIPLVLQSAILPGALAISKAGEKTRPRLPWSMPAFSKEVQGNKGAESEWRRLWTERNQAKAALNNVNESLRIRKRMKLDYTRDEAYSKVLLKKFEDADGDFWKFATTQ